MTATAAPTKTLRFDDDVAEVLRASTVDGSTLALPDRQLERDLYQRVNKVLKALGGKWQRHQRVHQFPDPESAQAAVDAAGDGQLVVEQLGWFPTPPALADRVVELAEIEPHHLVLEPSAGEGALAQRVTAIVSPLHLYAVELDPRRYDRLRGQLDPEHRAGIMCNDFLTVPWIAELDAESGAPGAGFDRVVMNPPFERQQAWQHVERAYRLLKPGGRLVSIMPATYRELVALRAKMPYADTIWREVNQPDAFKESGTMVRTITIVLTKYPA